MFWFQEMLTLEEFEFLPCGFLIFLEWRFVLFNPLIEKNSTWLLHSPQIWYFIVQSYENLKDIEKYRQQKLQKMFTFHCQEFRVQPISSILWILWCRELGHKKIRATLFIQIWITGSHKFFLVIIPKLQIKTYWWKLKQWPRLFK